MAYGGLSVFLILLIVFALCAWTFRLAESSIMKTLAVHL
jgi:hypothetical protein